MYYTHQDRRQCVRAGMWFRFSAISVNQTQYVDFHTSGPLTWVLRKVVQLHTNSDGFWEDLNAVHDAGMNIGYHPTNKRFNLVGRILQTYYGKVVKALRKDIFGTENADMQSGAFGQNYIGHLPNLLNPNRASRQDILGKAIRMAISC